MAALAGIRVAHDPLRHRSTAPAEISRPITPFAPGKRRSVGTYVLGDNSRLIYIRSILVVITVRVAARRSGLLSSPHPANSDANLGGGDSDLRFFRSDRQSGRRAITGAPRMG